MILGAFFYGEFVVSKFFYATDRNFETAVAAPLHGARGLKVPAGRSPAL
jgi:hypothetical protein